MKTTKIDLTKLRNEEHFQFMTDVKNLVETTGATTLNIEALFSDFTDLYGKEDIAVEAIRKSALTNAITDADAERDTTYRGFVLLVQTYSHSSNADKFKAAQNIQIIIDHYGDFRNKSYNEETATIYNFTQDINSRCSGDIQVLNAQEWISDLEKANKTFDNLMNQRFDDHAGQEIINMRETRKAINKTYTQMIDRINASILLNGEQPYADFVNKLNERIVYFRHTVAQRKGHTKVAKAKNQQT